jgi:hypothetical protein
VDSIIPLEFVLGGILSPSQMLVFAHEYEFPGTNNKDNNADCMESRPIQDQKRLFTQLQIQIPVTLNPKNPILIPTPSDILCLLDVPELVSVGCASLVREGAPDADVVGSILLSFMCKTDGYVGRVPKVEVVFSVVETVGLVGRVAMEEVIEVCV